jgi:uncharacterized caspase-like protein
MRPLKILLRLCVLLSVAFLARAEGPPPEPRTALIIGNADYSFAPLKNPINDAEAMASALEGAGFKVIKETNADQAKMVEAVRTFGAELKKRGGVGLFYFSGHGTQIDGENYLLPVGSEFRSLEDVKRGSVTALAVVDAMASGRSDLNIIGRSAARATRATASSPAICLPSSGALPRRWSMLLNPTAAWRAFGMPAKARKL